jgi:hypothetical protein
MSVSMLLLDSAVHVFFVFVFTCELVYHIASNKEWHGALIIDLYGSLCRCIFFFYRIACVQS